MNILISLVSGIIFALGLSISGMVNPDKVIGFLDVFGDWDYDLAFVMGGAVLVNLITFTFIKKLKKPFVTNAFSWPSNKDIDSKLILGSVLFGIGWGLIGICPGPALVNLILLNSKMIVFVMAMIAGMFLFKLINNSKS